MRRLILCLCLVTYTLGQDTPQRVVGPPHCMVNSKEGTMSMRFVTKLNGDPITAILGMRYNTTSSTFNIVSCPFTTETVAVGNTGAGTYYVLESTLPLTGATDATATNPCGFVQSTTIDGNNKYEWRLALRIEVGFEHDIDRDYFVSCLEETATNIYVWINLEVNHDDLEQTLVPTTPNVTMQVLTVNPASGQYEPTTSCTVGEDAMLELVYDIVDYVEYLKFWGLYSYDTKVARSSDSAVTYNLIGSDGCNYASNILGMAGGFTRLSGSDSEMFKARTGVFKCRRFWDSFDLYFATHVKFCAGQMNQDNKCNNFCNVNNPTAGRRRRQAADNDDFEVSVHLIVREANEGGEKTDALSGTVIIAITVTVGVVVLVAVLSAIFFCFRSRRHDLDDSRASSERSLPVKF